MKTPTNTLATAVRIEHNPETDQVLVVFEIIDPLFKQRVKADWMQDLELVIVGRGLKENI